MADASLGSSTVSTQSLPTGNARTVAGLMMIAVLFSVIGAEIKSEDANTGPLFTRPFVIIAGGTVATAILTLISEAGDAGRRFGIGMASLACITATLVNGGPVWKAFDDVIGAKPTGTTGTTTPTSTSTGATK